VSLAPGTRLGSHEIVGLLGAGGMGEVYLAHDTKLNRRVAIKVLPEAYASDPDRIARFHREAQAVAALNHSGIAAIYDLAEADGTKFLVLELIEGDTLAERLRRGPMPVEEALQIAKQILEALEAAHERGVCHRDLKPANIKLTPDGSVKVLDFGLAKFLQSGPSAPNMTHSPTLSLAGTYPGVILGTAGYMSPEQAKGFEADQRSDIFSFGCILYELLTGRQAFEGETASEILASVLKSDVDWTALPPRLNPRLVELLRRCLEKNPKKRWHAAADVRVEIDALIGHAVVVEEPAKTVAIGRPLWKRALSAAMFTLAGAAIAGYAAWTLKPSPPSAVTRFAIPLPEGQTFTNIGRQALALSPDGAQLVYVADNRLYSRPLSGFQARPIPGSESATGVVNPAFSPDGQSIAFRNNTDGTLKRLALSGGAAVTICQIAQPYGLSWHDEAIVWGEPGKGVLRVSPNGGVPEVIAAVTADEVVDGPQLLPDNRGVMFSVRKLSETWDQAQIVVQPFGGGARKTVINGGADPRYLRTGHIAYALGGIVLGVPFDLETLTVGRGPVPLVEGVRRGAPVSAGTAPGSALFAVSRNGSLAYLPGPVNLGLTSQTDLALFDRKGGVEPLRLPPGPYRAPRVSRDGKWVAFESADERNAFISVYEIGGRTVARRLTFDGNNRAPLWSPDGEWVVFASDRQGDFALFRTRADGSGTAEQLTTPEKGTSHAPQSWSRGEDQLLFSAEKGTIVEQSRLWLLTMKDRKVTAFGDMAAREATISPDGRWIAYGTRGATGNSGTGNQVFVEPFPRTEAKYLLPQPGGHPMWSPKSDELITNTTPVQSHLTPVITAARFAFGPSVEFPRRGRAEINPVTGRRQVDMMPDGRVMGVLGQATTAQSANEILVVLNWHEELKQRVPIP
jgi:serine/threonine protein kinase/Tol biopolymer transport system component